MIPYVLRTHTEDDIPFILNSFLLSYHKNSFYTHVPNEIYFPNQTAIINHILRTSNVLLAVYPEDTQEIISYILFENYNNNFLLHFIYVKAMYRNKDVATSMLNTVLAATKPKLIVATHITNNFPTLKTKIHNTLVVYDPYILLARMNH